MFVRKDIETDRGILSCLTCDKAGENAPLLIFHHATGFNANTYRLLLKMLSEKVRIIAPDARGHGFSKASADPRKLKDWRTFRLDLESLVSSIGEQVFLAGHSFGGVVSMELAAIRPEMVKGLTLIDPTIFPPNWTFIWGLVKKLGLEKRAPIASRAAKRNAIWPSRQVMFDSYCGHSIFKTWPPESVMDYIEGGARERPDGKIELTCSPAWESATFASLSHRQWQYARTLKCPASVVHGGRSDTFLPAAAKRLREILPNAKWVKVDNATHFVPMEFPDLVAEAILSQCLRST